jgi:hypothetical protein
MSLPWRDPVEWSLFLSLKAQRAQKIRIFLEVLHTEPLPVGRRMQKWRIGQEGKK